MKNNQKVIEEIFNLRYKSGKVHIFHSINKLINRVGSIVNTEKVYINKEYLSYLSEKMYGDKNGIGNFLSGNNKFVRLSFAEEIVKDSGKDLLKEIQEDFMDLKKINSSIFTPLKERLTILKDNENEEITIDDLEIINKYLKNWKRLEKKIKYFIPEEFYSQKNNYFYTSIISYVKFFDKFKENYEIGIKFVEGNI